MNCREPNFGSLYLTTWLNTGALRQRKPANRPVATARTTTTGNGEVTCQLLKYWKHVFRHPGALSCTVPIKFSLGQRYWGTSVSHSIRAGRSLIRYFRGARNGRLGCALWTRHGFARGHAPLGHGHVRFADGPVDFAGPRWSFEAVGQQIALQSQAVGPDAFQRCDVFHLEFVEFALRIQNSRI